MIVKGSQRGGGRALAAHLLNLFDNDHVEVHGIEGLVSSDVTGAFVEIEAISRATRCKQPFFSVSISPPKGETVVMADFENAIAQVADATGLAAQPRVIIFHEKEARPHCHVVFSRIDPVQMKAINLPFFKNRLTEVSRELYLTHGFTMPKGLADKSVADPLNFSLEEWQVAKRADRDPREIKAALKQCWAQSDSATAFAAALKERGFWLCRGDRRGFVALDYKENVYSLSRWLDVKATDLKARLGKPERLASVEETAAAIAIALRDTGKRLFDEVERRHVAAIKPILVRRQQMVECQRRERHELKATQDARLAARVSANKRLLRGGLRGAWDWLTGRRSATKRMIESEAERSASYDSWERQAQREKHLSDRRVLQDHLGLCRVHNTLEMTHIHTPFTAHGTSRLESTITKSSNMTYKQEDELVHR